MDHAAGIVLYRRGARGVELLIAHLGGPYFARKDDRGWVVPKGLVEPGEHYEEAARREWREETGHAPPPGPYHALAPIRQSGAKTSHLFLAEGDLDAGACRSNTFALEWPPRSGRRQTFPELDRFAWADLPTCRVKLVKGLVRLVDLVEEALAS